MPDTDPVTPTPAVKQLLGGAAVLQTVLTLVGVSNGGIAGMVINHRSWVSIGFGAVGGAVAIGAVVVAFKIDNVWVWRLGTVLLIAGIAITGYVALVGPAVAKTPDIDVSLSQSSEGLVLTAHVKVSGIPENKEYWFEVDAREYKQEPNNGGKYVSLGTPLYQNQLGADSEGDIDTTVTIPLPPGNYPALSVEAWSGPHAGPCGSLEVPGGAALAHETSGSSLAKTSREGCVILRLPASTTATTRETTTNRLSARPNA
jgi:hypothetical protein